MVFTGQAWISGWGKLTGDNNILPTQLQIVQLPIISNQECGETWGAWRITPQSICVGGEGHGACNVSIIYRSIQLKSGVPQLYLTT